MAEENKTVRSPIDKKPADYNAMMGVIGRVQEQLNQDDNLSGLLSELAEMAGELAAEKGELEKNRRLINAGKAMMDLSHSAKNILQMVGGASEVIDYGLRTNEIHRVKKSWDILKPNLQRLRKFVLDMLDYSKDRRLEAAKCDFNRTIQGSIETLKDQLRQKKSKIFIRIDKDIPETVLDEERIHEMSLNLILNAIDIVDSNTGVVRVETKDCPDSDEVMFSVTDNGPGMTEEMKDKIFEPFESGKNKFGTGLGMAIAKQIVDQHKGRIEIDTKLNEGSTFRVYLPKDVTEAVKEG